MNDRAAGPGYKEVDCFTEGTDYYSNGAVNAAEAAAVWTGAGAMRVNGAGTNDLAETAPVRSGTEAPLNEVWTVTLEVT